MISQNAEALREQRAAMKRKSCELSATCRARTKIKQKYARRIRDRLARHEEIGAVLLAKAGADFDLLRQYSTKKIKADGDHDDFVQRVACRFLAMPEAELATIVEKSEEPSSVMLDAERFLLDYSVHNWIHVQNSEKGVAPTVGDTLRKAEDTRRALLRTGQAWISKQKVFARSLQVGPAISEYLAPEERASVLPRDGISRSGAREGWVCDVDQRVPLWLSDTLYVTSPGRTLCTWTLFSAGGPQTGAVFRPLFWGRLVGWYNNVGPFLAPKSCAEISVLCKYLAAFWEISPGFCGVAVVALRARGPSPEASCAGDQFGRNSVSSPLRKQRRSRSRAPARKPNASTGPNRVHSTEERQRHAFRSHLQ